MRLRSNFSDVFDGAMLDRDGPTLVRMNDASGPSKREQFVILAKEFRIPRVGTVRELFAGETCGRVVMYTDESAHCGDGKSLVQRGEICGDIDNPIWSSFASEFIGVPGRSLRRLQVGRSAFWLEYKSTESWMSNVGDGTCELVDWDHAEGFLPSIRRPFYAVDFVADEKGDLYAIDFNIAPGIRGTGVERVIDGRQFVERMEEAREAGYWEGQE